MSELRDLYQETILDHGKQPRNTGSLDDADGKAEGRNPLCGDAIHVYVKVDGDIIERIRFEGNGCAISTASASMMTQMLEGKRIDDAKKLFELFHDMVTGVQDDAEFQAKLGKLVALGGVREFPVRVKCATLPWHTLRAALDGRADTVTTETE